jgi:hypothetical protein
MRRSRIARGLASAVLLAGVGALCSACIEDEGMFYAVGLIRAEQGVFNGDQCRPGGLLHSTAEMVLYADSNGFVYSTASDYAVCLLNKIKSSRDNGVETSNVVVYEYEISLGGGTATRPVFVTVSADTDTGSAQLEGGIFPLQITLAGSGLEGDLNAEAAATSSGVIQEVATVIVRGRTTGGLEVDTPEFYVPVRVYGGVYPCSCVEESLIACPEGDPACG